MGPTISPRSCGWPGEPWPGGNLPAQSSSSSLWMAPSCLTVLPMVWANPCCSGKGGNGAENTSPWGWRGCRGQDSTWCSSRGTSPWPEGRKGARRSPVRDGAPRAAVLGVGRERGPPAGAGEGFCGIFTPHCRGLCSALQGAVRALTQLLEMSQLLFAVQVKAVEGE